MKLISHLCITSLIVGTLLAATPAVAQDNTITIEGQGWGHGVGMSQWGAYGLAQKGSDFRRILTYFYKGVKILPFSATSR